MAKNFLIILTYVVSFVLTAFFIVIMIEAYPTIPIDRIEIWAQSFMGISGFVMLVVFFRKYLYKQTKEFLKTPGTIVAKGVIGYVVLFASSMIVGVILMELGLSEASENQVAIESLFDQISQVDLIVLSLTIAVFTPVVEEIVFRKGVYGLVGYAYMSLAVKINPEHDHKKGSRSYVFASITAILGSGLLFGLLHVMSGDFINLISFGVSGIVLGGIYYFSNRNIYAPIIAHVINNLVGLIVILSM